MINLEDQLSGLPDEFFDEMEKQKSERWKDVFIYLTSKFKCIEEIKEMHNSGTPIIDFLRNFYDMGFYSGVNFTLDPQEEYKEQNDYEESTNNLS